MGLSWRGIALVAIGAVVGATVACGETTPQTPDAGVDAGDTQKDAGTLPTDAGDNEEPDAGMELPDAGEEMDAGIEDAGTEPNCGDLVTGTFSDQRKGTGWPELPITQEMPTCATGNAAVDCNTFFVERFTDQNALETFFWAEFQSSPPYTNVNWSLVDVLVTYNCACPTMGYTLETTQVSHDTCRVLVDVKHSTPGETCFTFQIMDRQFTAVQVPKIDEGMKLEAAVLSQAVQCE